MTEHLTVGEALLIARRRAGLTARDAAAAMRINAGTLCNWENDRTVPRDRDLIAYCDMLGLDPEDLSPGIRSRCSTDTAGEVA